MRGRAILLFALALLMTGTTRLRPTPDAPRPDDKFLSALRAKGTALKYSRRYSEAAAVFQEGRREALKRGEPELALWFLNQYGGTQFAMFQYRSAMQAYIEVRRQAKVRGDDEMLAVAAGNLSSLYLQQNELNAGAQAAEEALEALKRHGRSVFGALLRAQVALIRARQGRFDAALALFAQALGEAEGQGDPATSAMIWDLLGHEYFKRGNLDESERASLNAFRIRWSNRLPDLQYSFYSLGILQQARGNALFASTLFDRTLSGSLGIGTLPLWHVYYQRSRARMAQGRASEALEDLLKAADSARRLRLEMLPADSVMTQAGVDQNGISTQTIRTCDVLLRRTGDPKYARIAFEASEENRAGSLRALIYGTSEYQKRLTPAYWEALAELRSMEADLVGGESSSARARADELQYRLTEMEARAGLDLGDGPTRQGGGLTAADSARSVLGSQEAFVSFRLDEPVSYRWWVTRDGFSMSRLASGGRISALVRQFQRAVALDLPERITLASQLYSLLFGSVPSGVASKTRWILAPDSDLFQLPFAALVTGHRDGKPVYLIERRSLRIVPSALLLQRGSEAAWDGPFVGVGDPIYNGADPRWSRARSYPPPQIGGLIGLLPAVLAESTRRPTLELARLPGSAREIRACSAAWGATGSGAVTLSGQQAAIRGLETAFSRRPSIIHFATHFLSPQTGPRGAIIALSLDSRGLPELLSPTQIARWRQQMALIVLSGCSSATAETLPAEGLMGMTRAWLAAGAHSVLASLWPTPDESGSLFVSFYAHLASLRKEAGGNVAAEALRLAQLDMLRTSAWQSKPGYWAPYSLVGKE